MLAIIGLGFQTMFTKSHNVLTNLTLSPTSEFSLNVFIQNETGKKDDIRKGFQYHHPSISLRT